jgi:hypothetical protein
MTKISILALLVVALAVPSLMLTQNTTTQQPNPANPSMTPPPDQNSQSAQPDTSQPAQTQSDQAAGTGVNGMNSKSAQMMSGTLSADGKTFTSNNTTYTISNPASVKAYANQPISIEYEMDTNNSIRVTKVILTQPKQ